MEIVQNSTRKSKCKYWNKCFCLKGDQCSRYHSKKTALNTSKEEHAQKECAMKDTEKSVGACKIKPKDVGDKVSVNIYTRNYINKIATSVKVTTTLK